MREFPPSLPLLLLSLSGQRKSRPHSKRRKQRARRAERLEKRWLLTSDPIVTVDTNFGNFQIELRPDAAPNTVANFLSYVESGAYTDTIFHRSVPGFVEQAGGFTSTSTTFTSTSQFTTIPTNAAVDLEYDLPNIAGSVAMARTSDPNSATDQWFVNLTDNSTTLGPGGSDQYGYTVFGQVIGDGMQVINAIAALNVDNADNGGTFGQLPLGPSNELVQISSVTIDSIDGTVFSDTNGNGQLDSGEQGVAGRTLFVDLAGTGVYQSGDPTATTDSNGNYSFTGISPGAYNVYEELPTDISLTTPSESVTVAANGTASGVNFAEEPSITGTVFTDTSGSGVLSSGETGIAGQTVFLNNDGSGAPDASNPSTVTDSNGNYSFSDLAAGSYTVDVVPPTGTTITTSNLTVTVTAGGTAQVLNIGEQPPSIVGTVFTDANDNATFDSGDIGVAGRTVFIDEDGSGSADGTNPQTTTNSVGQFTFSSLAAGSYTVEEVLPTGGTLTTPTQTVTVTAGQTTTGVIFGELPSITGTVFVDLNQNGQFDSGEPGLAGQTVFLNIDGSGAPDADNPSTTTDSNGNYAFGTEPAGAYSVEVQLSGNVTVTTSTQSITVTTGQTASGINLGELPSITGMVFTDTAGTGVYQSGDAGVAGRTVFLDNDGSGAPDSSNPSATTDANGNYFFLGLAPGSYTVTEVIPSGITLTTSPQTITVTAGEVTSGVDIGESGTATGTASISGTVFDDLDLSGQFVSGDPGLAGRTVFLNVDGSGTADGTNPQSTTDANGNFSFTDLAASDYGVMEVIPADNGVTLTTTVQTVTLADGQNVSGVDIGDAVTSTILPLSVSLTAPAASSDPNTAYINALYQTILGHAPDATGLAYWQGQLSSGASLASVVQGIWNSTEHRTEEVVDFYHEFLGRDPDTQGEDFWVNAFNSWGTEELEVVGFLTSTPEFQSLNSGDTIFVDAIYNDVLQRSADSAGESTWVNDLASGATPLQVAMSFVYGREAATALVDGFYSDFLHRAPDTASLSTWVDDLAGESMTAEQLTVQILSSDEYFNRVTGSQGPAIASIPDTTFTVGAAGSINVQTSAFPAVPSITVSGLPADGDVTLTDNGDGTATIAGTPTAADVGTYDVTVTATDTSGETATQSFTLTIGSAPAFTSSDSLNLANGAGGTFDITTSGDPNATITDTDASLPSGVTVSDNGDGTATLAVDPSTAAGTYTLNLSASNGVGVAATQQFTLTIS
jgi:cyclophilin family peptidyl-prolyl cis-trans isomerase